MSAHNHDLDPSCPEVTMPNGSVRGACMDQAQIVSTRNERHDLRAVDDCEAVRVTVGGEGVPAGYTMVVADMRHACGRVHSYTKVFRSIDVYPYNLDSVKRSARDAVLRAAKDCEMGIGTPDRAPDAPTGRLAHREGYDKYGFPLPQGPSMWEGYAGE